MFAETHWFAIGIPIMVSKGWLVLEEWMLPDLFNEFHQQFNGVVFIWTDALYFELVFVNFNSNDTTNIWCFLFMTLNITIVTTSGEIHDEWTLAENVPQPDYRTRMSRHWDEWISRKPSSYLFHHPSSILFIYEYFSPPCQSIVKKYIIFHMFNFSGLSFQGRVGDLVKLWHQLHPHPGWLLDLAGGSRRAFPWPDPRRHRHLGSSLLPQEAACLARSVGDES